jgi:hypothetical protein
MHVIGFTEAFIELFNINAAIVILFCCGYILFKIHKMDLSVLKARVFLNKTIVQQTWIYIAIAGISIAFDAIIKFLMVFNFINNISYSYYIVGLIQIIFLIAFTVLVYSWSLFVSVYADGLHYGEMEKPY